MDADTQRALQEIAAQIMALQERVKELEGFRERANERLERIEDHLRDGRDHDHDRD